MSKDYDISKTEGTCVVCGRDLKPQEEFIAAVRQVGEELQREDYCEQCWTNHLEGDSSDLLAVWRTRLHTPEEKRKLFVDDDLLINFFERLADEEDSTRQVLRYVLALVLMRKKLLIYDRTEREEDGTEVWQMHFRGTGLMHSVIDPGMDEDKIAEVSGELGEILEGEL